MINDLFAPRVLRGLLVDSGDVRGEEGAAAPSPPPRTPAPEPEREPMYIVIIGMGEVGRHLLRVLEHEGHDLVAIDERHDAIAYVEDHHDVMTLVGYGASTRSWPRPRWSAPIWSSR
ncbi:MAG: NAD-binding protein [Sandaracinaceae bacterium]|nr:NAD-binding protein [Sandaracinaceae bacterium]